MARRNRRIDRKLHKRFLDLGVIDASQDSGWRRRLFAAAMYQSFTIDAQHTEGLPDFVARGLRRYELSYTVCRVPESETPFDQEGYEGYVFLRFQASRHPEIVNYAACNPDVV